MWLRRKFCNLNDDKLKQYRGLIRRDIDEVMAKLNNIDKKVSKLEGKHDKHINEIWTVYKPIKELLTKLEKFKLW